MKKKQGISLIVLVITIIVMIILAASVVLTLSNSGIIEKANTAVEATNIKEVQQLATIVWADEFMAGKRGDALKETVLEKLKDYTDKYTITVTDDGVTVGTGSEGDSTPSEPTSPYKLSGAWLFNGELALNVNFEQKINIKCAEKNFTSIKIVDGCINYCTADNEECVYDPNVTAGYYFPGWSNEIYPVVDFGETPQPVSEEFYNWFMANASQEYVVTFTIEGVKYSIAGYMTLDDWLETDYNTRGYQAIDDNPAGTGMQIYLYTSDGKSLVYADTNERVYVPYAMVSDGAVIIVDPSLNEQ